MFLSCCDRDLGVPSEFQQGRQDSSYVEAWNSTLFSSCKRVVRPPVELRRGTQPFSRGATEKSDLPSFCEGILVVPFDRCRRRSLSQVDWELGVVSICGRKPRVPLEFQYVTALPLRCEGKVGIHLDSKQGNHPHFKTKWGTWGFFRLWQENRGSSRF